MKFTLEIELGKNGTRTIGDIKALLACAMNTCTVPDDETFSPGWSRLLPAINGKTVGKWTVLSDEEIASNRSQLTQDEQKTLTTLPTPSEDDGGRTHIGNTPTCGFCNKQHGEGDCPLEYED